MLGVCLESERGNTSIFREWCTTGPDNFREAVGSKRLDRYCKGWLPDQIRRRCHQFLQTGEYLWRQAATQLTYTAQGQLSERLALVSLHTPIERVAGRTVYEPQHDFPKKCLTQ